ncbi:MAG: peptide deformylase [Rubricoccaceae bacterium]
MILPIYTYGQPVLRARGAAIEADSPELQRLIDDMIETMHHAAGIGLAAPQIGQALRLFVVDLSGMAEDLAEELGHVPAYAQGPLVFINPEVTPLPESPRDEYEEGCLSIPDIREVVVRPERVRVRFLDRHFQPREIEAEGLLARVVQHENDHVNGVLFIDYLSPLRKRLLGRRLREMARGRVEADYPLAPASA